MRAAARHAARPRRAGRRSPGFIRSRLRALPGPATGFGAKALMNPVLSRIADAQPYPLVFATISGAHLYGFPSADSDFDLRGVHVLPLREVLGLRAGPQTIEETSVREGVEIDLVTHEARKFIEMLLKRNGYVLEQLLSPLVVRSSPAHETLYRIAPRCITRQHAHHYLRYAADQWRLFEKARPPRVKPLLYVYRVLLTGIHLMRTGEVQANLQRLSEAYRLPRVRELIDRKMGGPERGSIEDAELDFHGSEYRRLAALLAVERDRSSLPDEASAEGELNQWLLDLRLGAAPIG